MSDRDWPVDPDGDRGSEGRRKYGMAIIAEKVTELEWPLETEAFLAEYGDHPVRVNQDTLVSVADIFEHVDADSFEDVVTFHRAVGDAMREGGFWDYHPVGADPDPNRA